MKNAPLRAVLSRTSIIVAFVGSAATLRAQHAQTVVRVQVTDTAGVAIANADVSLLHQFNTVAPVGSTDAGGVRRFVVPRGTDELQVVVRQIGYQRGDRFFIADRDSLALVVRLRQTPQQLAPVQVTESEDLKQKRFHVTADDIAASKRLIADGLDVVTKLRPDMMDPPGQGIFTRCGLYDIWINGKRIVFPPIDPGLAIQTSQKRRAARAAANGTAGRSPNYTGTATVPVSVQSVLAKIHPEHIEEMNYVDCRDSKRNEMVHGQNAVFVALKPGVAYDAYRGTYALETSEQTDPAPVDSPRTAQTNQLGRSDLAGVFRNRLLGVFDASTGDPISDAQIVDLGTGTVASTTKTGTVTLRFLPEGVSKIRVRRDGYQTIEMDISISPRDTVPVTLILTPQPPTSVQRPPHV